MENRVGHDTPWDQPAIKNIIEMFGGTVSKITPLNQIQVQVGGDSDEQDVHR